MMRGLYLSLFSVFTTARAGAILSSSCPAGHVLRGAFCVSADADYQIGPRDNVLLKTPCDCVPYYQCDPQYVYQLISLISLFAMARSSSTGMIGQRCPLGYIIVGGHCVTNDDFDDWEIKPDKLLKPTKPQCDCVPYFQCPVKYIRSASSQCKESTDVCCQRGAPESPCGWGLVGAEDSNEGQRGEFPWMVAILNPNAKENWTEHQYIGGGSIIHPRFVLTVAHRVAGKHPSMCRAGQWSRLTPEPNVTQDRLVYRIHTYPAYDRQYLANDIALLELDVEFDVSQPMVQPVCLALEQPSCASKCFAMGWGRRRYTDTDLNVDKLKKIKAPWVSSEVCWRALQAVDDARRRAKGLEVIERLELHSSLMCAGGVEGQDTCVGDGGSPLVCELQNEKNKTHSRWVVSGLVAWGAGCGAAGAPGVYVNVAQFRAWIMRIVVF